MKQPIEVTNIVNVITTVIATVNFSESLVHHLSPNTRASGTFIQLPLIHRMNNKSRKEKIRNIPNPSKQPVQVLSRPISS